MWFVWQRPECLKVNCYDHLSPGLAQYDSYQKFQTGGGTAVYIRTHVELKELLNYASIFGYLELITVKINHQNSSSVVS